MVVSVHPHRWSSKRAGARLALALITAVLAYFSVVHALATVIQKRSPAAAHALAPHNGFITGRLANILSGPEATPQDRIRADQIARLALRQDPTALDAAATLGLNAQIRGDTTSARHLFAYAEALSRRDLQTQLWAIDDQVARNNINAALSHYDIALRTSNIAALLFPTLVSAMVDPTVRAALVRTLEQRPAWGNGFLHYAVLNSTEPNTVAALFEALLHRGIAIPTPDSAALVNALIRAGKLDHAWSYYAAIHSGADRRQSRDPGFDNNSQAPTPFDWVPTNDGSISAAIQPSYSGDGVLTFTAPPSIGGIVVQQLEMLPPGDYVLQGRSEGIDQPSDTRPYWTLTCRDGRIFGRVAVPNSTAANGHFGGRFTVPADCAVQVLALSVRPSSNAGGVTGQINRAMLRLVQ